MSWKEPESMPAFNRHVRELRRAHGATHRAISEAIGLKGVSYQNAEHKPFKAMARDKVERLAAFYGLPAADRAQLLAEWEALPASAYAEANRPRWTARNQARAKVRHHDAMQVALVEVLAVHLELVGEIATDVGHDAAPGVCTCSAPDPFTGTGDRTCEICGALAVLGYPGKFNGLAPVLGFLAGLQQTLAPAEGAC